MANTYTQKTVAWKHGINTLYAGTPLDTNGKTVNDETAIGILAEDLHMPDKTAKVLTAGEWDEDAHTASGIVISDAVKLKLTDITFSRPPKSLDVLALYVQKTDLATKEAAGIVKQSESVSSAAAAPTKADFNGLVEKLKDAGIIEPDSFNVSVLACPTPAQMPTAETAANSGHATVSLSQERSRSHWTAKWMTWRMRTTGKPGGRISGSVSEYGPGWRPLWASHSRTTPAQAPRWARMTRRKRPTSA